MDAGRVVPTGVELVKCARCRKDKAKQEFNLARGRKGGVQSYCRECAKAATKEWHGGATKRRVWAMVDEEVAREIAKSAIEHGVTQAEWVRAAVERFLVERPALGSLEPRMPKEGVIEGALEGIREEIAARGQGGALWTNVVERVENDAGERATKTPSAWGELRKS